MASTPSPQTIRAFPTQRSFERWLSQNHQRESELYLRIYKKGTGVPTITHAQALEVALCWGWIDAIRKSYDEQSFLQRFCPRGKKSIWSQVNRAHVERLIAEGRMTEHGLAHVSAAQEDGRWERAYASAREMTLPDDLLAAISAVPRARATLDKLDRKNLYALGFRLATLKTAAGRARKIATFVELLARGETLLPVASKPRTTRASKPR